MNNQPVLVVEDNPDDQVLIVRSLSKHNLGNPIVVADDGVQALDMLLPNGANAGKEPLNPALILLDIGLPKLSGIEVLERIRADKRTESLPVVMLTSSDEVSDIDRCYELTVNSYVCKPVKFEDFARAVKDLGLYWLILNKSPVAA